MILVVPRDPMSPRQPDSMWLSEVEAAQELGWPTTLVDCEALEAGIVRFRGLPGEGFGRALYRGWMLSQGAYETLAGALGQGGYPLWTAPEQYRMAHELPGWYPWLRECTPESRWFDPETPGALEEALEALSPGPWMVKDHVKSLKAYWDEALFIPEANRAAAVVQRFLELRGPDRVGGVVLRRFESLEGPEARTWWVNGILCHLSPHPDQPEACPDFPGDPSLARAVQSLALPFVTVDVARHQDGRWRAVEVGDGQVSDRPDSLSPRALLESVASLEGPLAL